MAFLYCSYLNAKRTFDSFLEETEKDDPPPLIANQLRHITVQNPTAADLSFLEQHRTILVAHHTNTLQARLTEFYNKMKIRFCEILEDFNTLLGNCRLTPFEDWPPTSHQALLQLIGSRFRQQFCNFQARQQQHRAKKELKKAPAAKKKQEKESRTLGDRLTDM